MGKHWSKAWKENITFSRVRRWRAKYDKPWTDRRRARRRRLRLLLFVVTTVAVFCVAAAMVG